MEPRHKNLCLVSLDYEVTKHMVKKWTEIYCAVNTDGFIYIYEDPRDLKTTKGVLLLTDETEVQARNGNGWFKCKIKTPSTEIDGRKNTFRTRDKNSRDMFQACVVVVAKGTSAIISSLELLPGQKVSLHDYLEIRENLNKQKQKKTTPLERRPLPPTPTPLVGESRVKERRRNTVPNITEFVAQLHPFGLHPQPDRGPPPPLPATSTIPHRAQSLSTDNKSDTYSNRSGTSTVSSDSWGSNNASGGSNNDSVFSHGAGNTPGCRDSAISDCGIFLNHKFFNNPGDNVTEIPSWFFENCSPEQAEKILQISKLRGHGNVLVRESLHNRQHGSYTLSVLRKKSLTSTEVQNFEIIRVPKGYRLGITENQPDCQCLYDVLKFVLMNLGPSYRPMATNKLVDFGLKDPSYATKLGLPDETEVDGASGFIYNIPSGESEQTCRTGYYEKQYVAATPQLDDNNIYVNAEEEANNVYINTDDLADASSQPAIPKRSSAKPPLPLKGIMTGELKEALALRRKHID